MKCQNVPQKKSTLNSSVWLGESYPSPSLGETHKYLNTVSSPESSPALFQHSVRNTYLQALDRDIWQTLSCDSSEVFGTRHMTNFTDIDNDEAVQVSVNANSACLSCQTTRAVLSVVLSTASTWLASLPNSPVNPLIKAAEQPLLTALHALT